MRGHCLCGSIKYEIDPPALSCVTCHCDSCRRQCAAPMTTYFAVRDGKWRWIGEGPKRFNSSPGVERSFCPHCGTPISFRSAKMSDVMHLYVATLETPEALQPTLHVSHEEKLSWLHLADGLPTCTGPDYTKIQPLPDA
ncbi:GFA family protein [Ruegeria sp. AD91A]|uniref:GFA family protein n=1 Tax=Ruegeria sp. AD91A TaxID=2293862 RepID=UPI000E52792D|nr:GFA family protein [Ruegeria sp. AD91A]AXT26489.1 GFA family protein [Ruegeria sp. AD91A]